MFGRGITLFRLLGFSIRLDASWIVIALLVTWSLAAAVFPQWAPNLTTGTYWVMGVLGAAGLFVSIILHELAHAVVAARYGIPIRSITLFIFGGVAEMREEPPNAKSEFLMAIAGPIMSLVLAGAFMAVSAASSSLALFPYSVGIVLGYLGAINALLAVFNLIPAFPLDGGRVLRAALWGWKKNYRNATRIASNLGAGFGIFLVVFGVLTLISGYFISGIWWAMIGLFLRGASHMSYQHALVREALRGEPVSRFMKDNPISVGPRVPLDAFVEDYLYRHHHKLYPVVDDDGTLLGCLGTRELREIPRDQWSSLNTGDVVSACDDRNTISPSEDALRALAIMNSKDVSRLMVVEDGHLHGIIALKDLLRFLSIRLDLAGEAQETHGLLPRALPAE